MKRTHLATAIIAVAMVALFTADLLAQEGGRRGRRGGGPGGRGGDPTMGLLRSDEVKVELDITEGQQAALDKLAERSRERGASGERPNFREMSEEERDEFIETMRKEQAERSQKTKELLEEVLLPAQMERLDQIALQAQGAGALENRDVREALKLSEDQIAELAETRESIQSTMREKMQELFQNGDRDAMREAFGQLREESEEKLFGVLTEDQNAQFEKMKGKPFDLPQQGFGRGGRRGGPGGPRGEGRRRGGPGQNRE